MPYTLTLEDLHDAWTNRSKDVYSFLVLDRAKIGIAFNSLWLVWSAENADYPDPICCEIGIARNAFQIRELVRSRRWCPPQHYRALVGSAASGTEGLIQRENSVRSFRIARGRGQATPFKRSCPRGSHLQTQHKAASDKGFSS